MFEFIIINIICNGIFCFLIRREGKTLRHDFIKKQDDSHSLSIQIISLQLRTSYCHGVARL